MTLKRLIYLNYNRITKKKKKKKKKPANLVVYGVYDHHWEKPVAQCFIKRFQQTRAIGLLHLLFVHVLLFLYITKTENGSELLRFT